MTHYAPAWSPAYHVADPRGLDYADAHAFISKHASSYQRDNAIALLDAGIECGRAATRVDWDDLEVDLYWGDVRCRVTPGGHMQMPGDCEWSNWQWDIGMAKAARQHLSWLLRGETVTNERLQAMLAPARDRSAPPIQDDWGYESDEPDLANTTTSIQYEHFEPLPKGWGEAADKALTDFLRNECRPVAVGVATTNGIKVNVYDGMKTGEWAMLGHDLAERLKSYGQRAPLLPDDSTAMADAGQWWAERLRSLRRYDTAPQPPAVASLANPPDYTGPPPPQEQPQPCSRCLVRDPIVRDGAGYLVCAECAT